MFEPVTDRPSVFLLLGFAFAMSTASPVHGDSSTVRLASYYDRHLAICAGDAHEWTGDNKPAVVMRDVVQVGVGRQRSYALAANGILYEWGDDPRTPERLLEDIRNFAAGNSGVLAIKSDGSLWRAGGAVRRGRGESASIATRVRAASVGDGTNYYVTTRGELFAHGNAHRGQYGDSRLQSTDGYVRVASDVREIRSHTGHAILLTDRGEVRGTGGNIHGPLAGHGLGDKAVSWGTIFDSAMGIATGASHSLAIRADQTLWIWGRNEGKEPRKVLDNVIGVAAGSDSSIALTQDGTLWQWPTGTRPRKILDCPR